MAQLVTGTATSDIIGVTLTDGTIQWSTIADGAGTTTLHLTDNLTGNAASGNAVYIMRWEAMGALH